MKKIKRYVQLFIVTIFVIFAVILFLYYKTTKQDGENKNKNDIEINTYLKEKQLENHTKIMNQYVLELKSEPTLLILEENGKIELGHDKIPDDHWLKWLINSEITIYADYKSTWQIKSDSLIYESVSDQALEIIFSKKDIWVRSEIESLQTSYNKALFGAEYKPDEVTALINLGKGRVEQSSLNKEKMDKAVTALQKYLYKVADKLGIEIKVVIRE